MSRPGKCSCGPGVAAAATTWLWTRANRSKGGLSLAPARVAQASLSASCQASQPRAGARQGDLATGALEARARVRRGETFLFASDLPRGRVMETGRLAAEVVG